ncbi:hypothetical protein BJ170DRAFT_98963 [Xylariales sp. AK1849]|nr:hypothetical protein BJ170DRAFT_98963 [Xylariales sp. AK1849]
MFDGKRKQILEASMLHDFHLFPRLPTELRLRIWSCSLPDSRIVSIHCDAKPSPGPSAPFEARTHECSFTSSAVIPASLHVCRESRSEALREYQLSFGTLHQPGKVFFNDSTDVLYFGARSDFRTSRSQFSAFLESIPPRQLARVRRLAVNAAVVWENPSGPVSFAILKRCLTLINRHLSHLEKLIFVRHEDNPIYSPDSVFIEENGGDKRLRRWLLHSIEYLEEHHFIWSLPPWTIMDMSAVPSRLQMKYDESVLGYSSSSHLHHRTSKLRQKWEAVAAGMLTLELRFSNRLCYGNWKISRATRAPKTALVKRGTVIGTR